MTSRGQLIKSHQTIEREPQRYRRDSSQGNQTYEHYLGF